jgi:hypothetical protein
MRQTCSTIKTNCLICNIKCNSLAELELHNISREHLDIIISNIPSSNTGGDFAPPCPPAVAAIKNSPKLEFTIKYSDQTTDCLELQHIIPPSQQLLPPPCDTPLPTRSELTQLAIMRKFKKILTQPSTLSTLSTLSTISTPSSENSNIEQCYFYLTKLDVSDYIGLWKNISTYDFTPTEKKTLITQVTRFLHALKALLTNNATTFEDKNIHQILNNIKTQ